MSGTSIQNGSKISPVIPETEFKERIANLRRYMESRKIDCVVLTSIHNIKYYTNFLYCRFGRHYACLITATDINLVVAAIDSGNPWRRCIGVCRTSTYTDWNKDNFYKELKLMNGPAPAQSVGYEGDHMSVQTFEEIKGIFSGADFVSVSKDLMGFRLIKSQKEIEIIRSAAKIANKACDYILGNCVGRTEVSVAQDATKLMNELICTEFPGTEFRDTWVWLQSGINTDGAHNALTSRVIRDGDLLSINCFPMIDGYYVALERTASVGKPSEERLRYWNINCEVFEKGIDMIRPGVKVKNIALELNKVYEKHGLLENRTFGYGHSFGVLSHYYGREVILEIREDNETVLQPGMVVSMEPHITIPDKLKGGGGYREHDILLVTETGHINLTNYKYGPDRMTIVPEMS